MKLVVWDVRVLRYGLYPVWFLGASQVLTQGPHGYPAHVRVGYSLFPSATFDVLRVLAVASAVPLLVVLAGIVMRSRKIPSLLTAAFFGFLYLHHYSIDATIWRSKGELIKALGRPQRVPGSDGLGRRADPAPQGAVG